MNASSQAVAELERCDCNKKGADDLLGSARLLSESAWQNRRDDARSLGVVAKRAQRSAWIGRSCGSRRRNSKHKFEACKHPCGTIEESIGDVWKRQGAWREAESTFGVRSGVLL